VLDTAYPKTWGFTWAEIFKQDAEIFKQGTEILPSDVVFDV